MTSAMSNKTKTINKILYSDSVFRCHIVLKVLEQEQKGHSRPVAINITSDQPNMDQYGQIRSISIRSIYRWLSLFEENGICGLLTMERSKHYQSFVLPSCLLDFCKQRKSDTPNISIPKLIEEARHAGIISSSHKIDRTTLWHNLGKLGIDTARKKTSVIRKYPKKKEDELWLRRLLQGKIPLEELKSELKNSIPDSHMAPLLKCLNGPIKFRNRALSIFATKKGIPKCIISEHLLICTRTITRAIDRYETKDISATISEPKKEVLKYQDQKYIDKVFSILHAPPSSFGINRTIWCQKDLTKVMAESGFKINQFYIRKIINNAGFNYRKAKKSLTSNDPKYKEKLKIITDILSNLGQNEKFFSIDEYGPFAIKLHGGLSLVPPGVTKSVPQWQKNKGSLIITAALELSTNQITHFYSENKNTTEMIKLLNILVKKYADQECIYFSWDAASWHASKAFNEKVDEINSEEYKKKTNSPLVKLAPLPTSAQFLNVIESVFSGMARAIIHNSDYQSVEEAKAAINRYFLERNEKFQKNPKRAGNKIWGKERVKAVFSETNCCKDPKYS